MSSLSATQADGYYNPPDWDPQVHGSRDRFQGSKGKNQFETKGIIRFELMYDSMCLREECKRYIGKGTRFNAKKISAGTYFTTTIWEFRMKCPSCPQRFVIRTDPENRDYAFLEGIKRMSKTLPSRNEDAAKAIGSRRKAKGDAFATIERSNALSMDDNRRGNMLYALKSAASSDDYAVNSMLRSRLRKRKKTAKKNLDEGRNIGLPFPLLPSSEKDAEIASGVVFLANKSNVRPAEGASCTTRSKREVARAAVLSGLRLTKRKRTLTSAAALGSSKKSSKREAARAAILSGLRLTTKKTRARRGPVIGEGGSGRVEFSGPIHKKEHTALARAPHTQTQGAAKAARVNEP
eukprot:g1810.t1